MLVLISKKGESILIYPKDISEVMTVAQLFSGGPIRIEIAETNHEQCQLDINAPKQLAIFNDELL